MTALPNRDLFSRANPHALATILEASETKHIIASRDIFDLSGTKLWARDQPVSQALQRKLLDRQLRNPLETCLLAEDGVTAATLAEALRALAASSSPLALLLAPHAARLAEQVPHVPLHPVVQLLLTAAQASRPAAFAHAVEAMALAGALMAASGATTAELRLAMTAGLVHDLGELYIDPRHGEADADSLQDVQSWRHFVVHPHVGQLLLAQLTNYPAVVARAVAEHHERQDGSGFPHALRREALSPLGRLLAVVEAALAVLRDGRAGLARASVALRTVPGEFDLGWVGALAAAARAAPALAGTLEPAAVQARLARLDAGLQLAQHGAAALGGSAQSAALKDALALGQHLLGRLRAGWNASGLWSPEAIAAQDAAEVEAVEDELYARLRGIERALRLRAGDALPPADAAALEQFAAGLRAVLD